jgi:hypothetical protein
MGAFDGSARLVGEIIGFGITAVLFIVCLLPIYFIFKLMSGSKTTFTEDLKEYLAWRWPFIFKLMSGSKTTFAEDLQEYLTARPQPRPETLRMLAKLDSVESTFVEIYKYLLIIALALGSVFIVWFFINVQNDAERSFLRFYFGVAYLVLVFWVVGNLVMIKRRQAQRALADMAQSVSPVTEPAIRASVDPAPVADVKTSPSQGARMTPLGLTQQEIIIVIMVFLFACGTFSVVLLMLWVFPRLIP